MSWLELTEAMDRFFEILTRLSVFIWLAAFVLCGVVLGRGFIRELWRTTRKKL
jgi:hypothetical protein